MLFFLLLEIVRADVCADFSVTGDQATLFRGTRAYDCLSAVPFDTNAAKKTIDTLEKSFELYSFLDIAMDPPDARMGTPINLMKGLKKIENRFPYANALLFHRDVQDLFNGLNDAHTRYAPPRCFLGNVFVRPIGLIGYHDDAGRPAVGVADADEVLRRVDYGTRSGMAFNASIYADGMRQAEFWTGLSGARVLSIDGMDPIRYLTIFANEFGGISKAEETRVMMQLMQFVSDGVKMGGFTARAFSGFTLPPLPSELDTPLTMVIQRPGSTRKEKIRVPTHTWVRAPRTITSVDDLKNWCDHEESFGRTKQAKVQSAVRLEKELELQLPFATRGPVDRKTVRAASSGFTQVVVTDDLVCYTGTTNLGVSTLVLFLPSFSITDPEQFGRTLDDCGQVGAAVGAEHLIVDLSENGGGIICAGYALLVSLGLESKGNLVRNPPHTDIPRSRLADAMFKRLTTNDTLWSTNNYQRSTGDHSRCGSDLGCFIPGHATTTPSGITRNFTDFVHLSDEVCGDYVLPPLSTMIPLANITLVSRGLCGSTCSLFAEHAQLYDHVANAVVAPFSGKEMMLISFPGGQVVAADGIEEAVIAAGISNLPFVPQFEGNNKWSMCARAIYGPNNLQVPLEYRWVLADRVVYQDEEEVYTFGSYWAKL